MVGDFSSMSHVFVPLADTLFYVFVFVSGSFQNDERRADFVWTLRVTDELTG